MAKKQAEKTSAAPAPDLDNHEFQQALQLLTHTNHSVFLTGKAGTGKSTFLRHVCKVTKKKHVVLAPTGIAAVNVGGQTIHSFFRMPFKPLAPDDPDFSVKRIRGRLKYPGSLVKLIKELELIVIDEISMVRPDTIDFIDKVLRIYSGNMRQPFGGKQLLLVGDIFQLEPVITGETRDILSRFYEDNFFFNARVFKDMRPIAIELRKVYRQKDDEFVGMLDRIRTGAPTLSDLQAINSHIDPKAGDPGADNGSEELTMTIAGRRDTVDAINRKHMDALTTPEQVYEGHIEGKFSEDSLPTERELVLKVGAQVVFIKNDMEKRWVNGTLGKVEECQDDYVQVRTEDGTLHRVEPNIWSNVRYEYNEEKKAVEVIVLGTYTQLPLKAAWALTVHKSQGLTFSRINIDLGAGAFAGGQTYVALSRCRSLEGIKLLSPIRARDAFVKPAIVEFSRTFNDQRMMDVALQASRADMLYVRASEKFGAGDAPGAAEALMEALALRNEAGKTNVARLVRMKALKFSHLNERIAELEAENKRLREVLGGEADRYVKLALMCSGLSDDEGATYDCEAAIRNLDHALELMPTHYEALVCKAKLLIEMGRVDDALKVTEECRKHHPLEAEVYVLAGDIMRDMDPIEAADLYMAADELEPDNIGTLERLVELYTRFDSEDLAEVYRERLKALKRKKRGGKGRN